MVAWDWNLVAQIALAIALGIGIGGWFVVSRLEMAMLRVAAHPSVRKLANAADKFSGHMGDGGGWPGLINNGLNFLTGGRWSQARQNAIPTSGRVMVVNQQGEQVGWAEVPEG